MLYVAKVKDTNSQLSHWFFALQDFDFTVQHHARPVHADGLSSMHPLSPHNSLTPIQLCESFSVTWRPIVKLGVSVGGEGGAPARNLFSFHTMQADSNNDLLTVSKLPTCSRPAQVNSPEDEHLDGTTSPRAQNQKTHSGLLGEKSQVIYTN